MRAWNYESKHQKGYIKLNNSVVVTTDLYFKEGVFLVVIDYKKCLPTRIKRWNTGKSSRESNAMKDFVDKLDDDSVVAAVTAGEVRG